MLELPPLSLYIHLPWCIKKCPYCDFNSHALLKGLPEQAYIERLRTDLLENIVLVQNRKLVSIFFGGGTPSLFSGDGISQILETVNQHIAFDENIEITLEANPGASDEAKFKAFKNAGVNRLSIGIQSFHDDKLKLLGRIHDKAYALRAINAAINAGFNNFNLDLMHGLPSQTVNEALADLTQALDFEPPHLSWYQLTLEPNTLFYQKKPELPSEDTLCEIQDEGIKKLNNYEHYEVSAYAKINHQAKHNLNYWTFGDYLGIGAGAHSKITDINQQQITRHWQVKNPKDYLDPKKSLTSGQLILQEKDLPFEFMLNALRLNNGVSVELFETRTGLTKDFIKPQLQRAYEKRLLVASEKQIKPTMLGQRFLNDLINLFMDSSIN